LVSDFFWRVPVCFFMWLRRTWGIEFFNLMFFGFFFGGEWWVSWLLFLGLRDFVFCLVWGMGGWVSFLVFFFGGDVEGDFMDSVLVGVWLCFSCFLVK